MESQLPANFDKGNLAAIDCSNQAASKGAATTRKLPKPLLIGVAGGTASGKTSLCDRIAQAFEGKIAMVSLDMFYKGLR